MKTFKRIQAMFLTVIMAIMTIGTTTAFAAEPQNEDIIWVEGEEFTVGSDSEITPRAYINWLVNNETFTIQSSTAGNPFVCRSNFMTAEINFTPSNGSVILAVRLIDQTTNQRINEWQDSDGHMTFNQNVTPGHTYIFEYLKAYGNQPITLRCSAYEIVNN